MQGWADQVSKSIYKVLQTTFKHLFRAPYSSSIRDSGNVAKSTLLPQFTHEMVLLAANKYGCGLGENCQLWLLLVGGAVRIRQRRGCH